MSNFKELKSDIPEKETVPTGKVDYYKEVPLPKHMILPHPGFEVVALPNGNNAKLGYKEIYSLDTEDLEIEFEMIRKLEPLVKNNNRRETAIKGLMFHYRRAISIISPRLAAGWNRWSDNILEIFLSDKLYKVVWGSGNCGKSLTFAILLYIKWRVAPTKRAVVIASKVMTDAKARVISYIKEIHLEAPLSTVYKFYVDDRKEGTAIYSMILNKDTGRWVRNNRGCIESCPIKTDAKKNELGANLIGRHPDDMIILAFDEAQEMPSKLLRERVLANWLTNQKLDVYAWGNPMPVDWHDSDNWDMLFDLGHCGLSYFSMKKKEKEAVKTGLWGNSNTVVLHLTMSDSPKDDVDERRYLVDMGGGVKDVRLFFLAGKGEMEQIAQKIPANSAAWYSQVLGFPFINANAVQATGVLTPMIVREAKKYPLIWLDNEDRLQWFMGVDPSLGDKRDDCCIMVGRMGMMKDGRIGIDLLNGQYCKTVAAVAGEEFMDTTVNEMHLLSEKLGIPLNNIAIDAHGTGDVLRYALESHIEDGKWASDKANGLSYNIINSMTAVSDRYLFKTIGRMMSAKEVVADCVSEYWIAVRCLFMSKQIFNVPEVVLQQFYNRMLLTSSNGTRYKVETKENMRKRGIRSPGESDALCYMVELMRNRGFSYKFQTGSKYNSMPTDMLSARDRARVIGKGFDIIGNLLSLDLNLKSHAGYVEYGKGGAVGNGRQRGGNSNKWYEFEDF